jgi:MSHA pilin protein MshD
MSMTSQPCQEQQSGFTLIELLITIVILAIAVSAFMIIVSDSVSRSADPMLRTQASAIGHAYLEEILSKQYADPDGVGGETRANYDDVTDYNGLTDVGARDINGNPIPALAAYTITVSVTDSAISGQPMRRIQVNVTEPGGDIISMVGYRGNI